jgi:hypothetical protein
MQRMLRRLHKLAFVGVAAWMLLSPAYVQVLGARATAVHAWRMYHSIGVGSCSAAYYAGGQRIDRYALFGLQRRSAPPAFRRIASAQQARAMGQRICEALHGGAAHAAHAAHDAHDAHDVRVTLRCGTPEGLATQLDREENLCGS